MNYFVRSESMYKAITILTLLLYCCALTAQENTDSIPKIPIHLGPFEGEAYNIVTKINKRFYADVEDQEPFALVKYDELNIVDRDIKQGFPQVNKTSSFGLVLRSKLKIPKGGTYGFELSSDDGSVLWIDNIRVIDNDGPHGFKSKANRICLSAGEHDIKVWYFQGWPMRFGLELEGYRLGDECLDPLEPLVQEYDHEAEAQKLKNAKAVEDAQAYFEQPIPILFDHWKSDIKPEYTAIISDIKSKLMKLKNVTIRIEGHTDDTGDTTLNRDLSRDRAEAVMNALYDAAKLNNNRILSVGYGASKPVAANLEESGRKLNRRVVVRILAESQQ